MKCNYCKEEIVEGGHSLDVGGEPLHKTSFGCADAMKRRLSAVLLQIRELQEDKEALMQQRDRAHAAADGQEKDLEAANRLNRELQKLIKRVDDYFAKPEIRMYGGCTMVLDVPNDLAVAIRTVAEAAALLDPKSPGWDEGANRLMKDLNDRRAAEKRKCVCGSPNSQAGVCVDCGLPV